MKILCVSLGCDKNLVDTEMMLGLLNKDGYTCLLYTSWAACLTGGEKQEEMPL